jgi:hypothetical protein
MQRFYTLHFFCCIFVPVNAYAAITQLFLRKRPLWVKMRFRSIHILLTIGLLALLACREKEFQPLAPGLMQEIIQELHFADAAAERFEGKQKPRNTLRDELYDQIMARYGLTREEFYNSYFYYLEETYILDSLYQEMIDSLQARTHELEKAAAGQKPEKSPAKITPPDKKSKDAVPSWQKNKPAQ